MWGVESRCARCSAVKVPQKALPSRCHVQSASTDGRPHETTIHTMMATPISTWTSTIGTMYWLYQRSSSVKHRQLQRAHDESAVSGSRDTTISKSAQPGGALSIGLVSDMLAKGHRSVQKTRELVSPGVQALTDTAPLSDPCDFERMPCAQFAIVCAARSRRYVSGRPCVVRSSAAIAACPAVDAWSQTTRGRGRSSACKRCRLRSATAEQHWATRLSCTCAMDVTAVH